MISILMTQSARRGSLRGSSCLTHGNCKRCLSEIVDAHDRKNEDSDNTSTMFIEEIKKLPRCGFPDADERINRKRDVSKRKRSNHNDYVGLLTVDPLRTNTHLGTTVLMKAEERLNSRLEKAGRKLHVVVVDASAGHHAGNDAFKRYTEGLSSDWRIAPRLKKKHNEFTQAEIRTHYQHINSTNIIDNTFDNMLASSAYLQNVIDVCAKRTGGGTPQLAVLDAQGRILTDDGVRHFLLDRECIGFPWSSTETKHIDIHTHTDVKGAVYGEKKLGEKIDVVSEVHHLTSSLVMLRAVQASKLCSILLLPPTGKNICVDVQCRILEKFKRAARSVVNDYAMQPECVTFLYSFNRQVWSEGLKHLLESGLAPQSMLGEVQNFVMGVNGAGAALLTIWPLKIAGGSQTLRYGVGQVEDENCPILSSSYMMHPCLNIDKKGADKEKEKGTE